MEEFPPHIRVLAKVIDGSKESVDIYRAIEDGELIVIVLDWVKLPSGRHVPGKYVACQRRLFLNVSGKGFDNALSPPIDMSKMPPKPEDFMSDIVDINPDAYRPWRN